MVDRKKARVQVITTVNKKEVDEFGDKGISTRYF